MLSTIITVSLIIFGFTTAQTLNSATITAKGTTFTLPANPLPPCAVACEQQAIDGSICTPTNLTCVCTDPSYVRIFDACQLVTCNTVDQEITNAYALGVCGVAIPGFVFRANTSILVGPVQTAAPTGGSAGNASSTGTVVPFMGEAPRAGSNVGLIGTALVVTIGLVVSWAL